MQPRNEAFCRKVFVEEFDFTCEKYKNDICWKCIKYTVVMKIVTMPPNTKTKS
jgi:hypothetical protein